MTIHVQSSQVIQVTFDIPLISLFQDVALSYTAAQEFDMAEHLTESDLHHEH